MKRKITFEMNAAMDFVLFPDPFQNHDPRYRIVHAFPPGMTEWDETKLYMATYDTERYIRMLSKRIPLSLRQSLQKDFEENLIISKKTS